MKISINFINKYLLFTLILSIGILLLVLKATKIFDFSGSLLVIIMLVTLPLFNIVFFSKNDDVKLKFFGIFFALYFLSILSYIYFISENAIVGFSDTHIHIIQYSNLFENPLATIDFSKLNEGISFNFIYLYIFSYFIRLITSLDIIIIAKIIPPFLNILTIIVVYLITSRLTNYKIGILSMLLFGSEIFFLQFGQEYRTQTMGTLFLFCTLFILIIYYLQITNFQKKRWFIIVLLFLISIVGTAFVTFINALVIFLSMIFSCFIIQYLKNNKHQIISNSDFFFVKNHTSNARIHKKFFNKKFQYCILLVYFLAFLIFLFLIYMMYIGYGFNSIFNGIINLWTEYINTIIAEQNVISSISNPDNFGQLIFGSYVKYSYYIYWGFFSISFLLGIFYSLIKRKLKIFIFLFSFGLYFLIGTFITTFGELNIPRIYVVGNIIIAFAIALFSTSVHKIFNKKYAIKIAQILTIFIIVIFLSASLAKFPHYIIGDTMPMRNDSPIDKVDYWKANTYAEFANDYLNSHYDKGNIEINISQKIIPYYLTKTLSKYNQEIFKTHYIFSNENSYVLDNNLIYSNKGLMIFFK